MKRSEELRRQIRETINGVHSGKINTEIANSIARLADVEIRSAVAEVRYGGDDAADFFHHAVSSGD